MIIETGLRCPLCAEAMTADVSTDGWEIQGPDCPAERSVLHSAYASKPWLQAAFVAFVEAVNESADFRDAMKSQAADNYDGPSDEEQGRMRESGGTSPSYVDAMRDSGRGHLIR